MKKYYILLMFMIMTTLLAVACKDNGAGDNNPPKATATPVPTETAAPTPTAVPKPTAAPTPTPEPTPTPIPSVCDAFDQMPYSGVYKMDIVTDDVFLSCDVNMVGGVPIIVAGTDDFRGMIYAVDPISKTYKQLEYGGYCDGLRFVHVDDEKFAVHSYADSMMTVYDKELNELGTISMLDEYENIIISDGGESVWFIDEDCLTKRDREGNVIDELDHNKDLIGAFMPYDDNSRYIIIDNYDDFDGVSLTVCYDTESRRALDTDGSANRFFVSPDGSETLLVTADGATFAGLYEGGIEECFTRQHAIESSSDQAADEASETEELPVLVRKTPKTEIKLESSGEIGITFMDWENRVYITSMTYYSDSNSVFELRCYSVDTGEKTAQYAISLGSSYIWPALSLDSTRNMLFFTCGDSSSMTLYCWDYMNDTADDSGDAFVRMDAIPDYIEEKRAAFEEKYDINLYIGSEVFASPFDYRLTICNDWAQVEEGIDILEEVFQNYPEGFFDQIKIDNIKTLGIYICAGFEKIYDYSADDAIALACVFGYERALALDMGYSYCLKRTIIHEVSHWIDGKIESAQSFGKCRNYEEDWNSLLPAGYSYKESYVSGRTVWKYIYYNADLEDTYFCDEYSQTYPGEDRARCFEYLMYGEEDGYMYMDAPHIQEKLALYFECIREAFDDSTWPEQTSWEEKLDYYINDWTPEGADEWFEDEYYDGDDYGEGVA